MKSLRFWVAIGEIWTGGNVCRCHGVGPTSGLQSTSRNRVSGATGRPTGAPSLSKSAGSDHPGA